MTPVLKGSATDDGLIVLEVVEPEPGIHWLWKAAYWTTFGGCWLGHLVGVLWSGQ
jgi:hypothetical protein